MIKLETGEAVARRERGHGGSFAWRSPSLGHFTDVDATCVLDLASTCRTGGWCFGSLLGYWRVHYAPRIRLTPGDRHFCDAWRLSAEPAEWGAFVGHGEEAGGPLHQRRGVRVSKVPRGEAAARFAREHQVSLAEAGRLFGISRERVRQKWRSLFGDEPTPMERVQEERSEKIAELANCGLTATEIARELDFSPDLVRRARDREGLAMVDSDDKVAVTAETREKILELALSGKGRAEIAHEVGVNYGTISKYLKGQSTDGARRASRDPHDCRSALASEVMDRTGCSLTEAAAMFVVPPPAVYAYRKRRGLWTKR